MLISIIGCPCLFTGGSHGGAPAEAPPCEGADAGEFGSGFRVLGFRVQGLGFWGLGFRV